MKYLFENWRKFLLKEHIQEKFEDPHNRSFIRFGKFGKSSRMGLDSDFLADIGSTGVEAGVSVYFTYQMKGKYVLVDPKEERARYGLGENYWGHMLTKALDVDNIFLVEGDLIRTNLTDEGAYRRHVDRLDDLEYELEELEEEDLPPEEYEKEAAQLNKEIEETKYSMKWTYDVGADGEPLLRGVRIIKQLQPEEIIFSEFRPEDTLQSFLEKGKGP